MVSEVGKVLLDAAEKGYLIEIVPYRKDDAKFDGVELNIYDELGSRIIKRIAASYEFLHTNYDPVCHNLREMIYLAEYARRETKNNG